MGLSPRTHGIFALTVWISGLAGGAPAVAETIEVRTSDELRSAMNDAPPFATVNVHAGTYDLGSDVLLISKSVKIVGVGEKPIIRSAHTPQSDSLAGVIEVNIARPDLPPELYPGSAPDVPREVELNHLSLESTASAPAGFANGSVLVDRGSTLLRVIDCDLTGAPRGVPLALSAGSDIWMPPQPARPSFFAVTGDLIVQSTYMKSQVTNVWIGWNGPVYSLGRIELSDSTLESWGGNAGALANYGNWGIGVEQYDFRAYLGVAHPIEGTSASTVTVIRGNTITAGNPVTTNVRGYQEVSGNTLNAYGLVSWVGLVFNFGVALTTDKDDSTASALVADNLIHVWVPQPPSNAITAAVYLGSDVLANRFPRFVGDFVHARVANNTVVLDSLAGADGTQTPSAFPMYGVYTEGSIRDVDFVGNDLTGYVASRAQVYLNLGSRDCTFADNRFGALTSTAAGVVLVDGERNVLFENDYSRTGASGWYAGDLQGSVLLGAGSAGNHVREGRFPGSTTFCDQVKDEAPPDSNSIPGFGVCTSNRDLAAHVQDALARGAAREPPDVEAACAELGGTWDAAGGGCLSIPE